MSLNKTSLFNLGSFITGVLLLGGLLALLSNLSPDKVTSPEVVRNNYEEGIEATALFYTEIDIPLE